MTKICEKHGLYEEAHAIIPGLGDTVSRCPKCVDEWDQEKEKKYNLRMAENQQVRIERWIDDAGIPKRFKTATFNSYHAETKQQREAFNMVTGYCDYLEKNSEAARTLIMTGTVGTGKTHLAIATVRRLIELEAMRGRYTSVMKMITHIRSAYGTGFSSEKIMAEYVNTGLLVLDEVGVQFGTDAEKLLIYEVMNGRYERENPTIIISNLPASDLEGYLGDRVIDRLREDGGFVVPMEWQSWRIKK